MTRFQRIAAILGLVIVALYLSTVIGAAVPDSWILK